MNLTAEQIERIKTDPYWRTFSCEGMASQEIYCICDMAKRTLEAEAEIEKTRAHLVAELIPSGFVDIHGDAVSELIEILAYHRDAACNELAALKNAATQVKGGQPLGQTNPSLNNTPAVAAPDLAEPKRWYFSGTLCRYVNGSLVETLHHSPIRSDPSPALVLYDDYAAALAERAKDAERYRARRDSDWCAYDEYCAAVMPRDGTAIRQNSEQFIAQYDQDSDFMLEDYIVGPDAAIDALRSRS